MKTDKRFREIVAEATQTASLVAFDTCHKIYIAMDEGEAKYYIDHKWKTFRGPADAMTEQVCEWYESSCGLEFVDATSTSKESTESEHFSDFCRIIPQGAEPRWGWMVEEDYWRMKESA